MKNNIQNLTLTALMAAILCIMGPIVIPIGMVPMSFANMVIYLTIILLDKKRATISVALYLLIGFVGIPVFSGFAGGAGKLFGPTGGYLIGYLVLSWIAGTVLEILNKTNDENKISISPSNKVKSVEKNINYEQMLALAVGNISLYLVGTMWLMIQSKLTFVTALSVGVLPFAIFDVIKIILAISIGNSIKKRISFL